MIEATVPTKEHTMDTYDFLIEGMHCASCVERIEGALKRLDGVVEADVNLGTSTVTIRYAPLKVRPIMLRKAIEDIGGYRAVQITSGDQTDLEETYHHHELHLLKRRLAICVGCALGVLFVMAAAVTAQWPWSWSAYAMLVLASVIQWWGGWEFYRGSWITLRHGSADMNVLVALGTTVAYGYSAMATIAPRWFAASGYPTLYYESAAWVITFVLLGRYWEAGAKRQANAAIRLLAELAPRTARVLRDGREYDARLADIAVGDRVVVRPGQTIPVDGRVIEGASSVNEALVSGESLPVAKQPGDAIVGGTINQQGRLVVQVTRTGSTTFLAQIVHLVHRAQSTKSPVQHLADRVAAYFVPAVLGIAAVTWLGWWLWGPDPSLTWAIYHSVAVLVVACPCALGLATPTAVVVAVGHAARQGIFIKEAGVLERAGTLTTVVFDKTGTLTQGRPTVTDIVTRDGYPEHELVQLAAGAESASEHPLAHALAVYAKERGITVQSPEAFAALPGLGVRGRINGQDLYIGSIELLNRERMNPGPLEVAAEAFARQGKTALFVAVNRTVQGIVAVADVPKPDAAKTIQALHEMGLNVAMMSGDRRATVETLAQQLGIDEVHSQILPHRKAAQLQQWQAGGARVAMVGDGLNDAPALAQADVGMAIGGGTDVAKEAGHLVLADRALWGVVRALTLARRTRVIIQQNLWWAFGYNLVGIPLAAGTMAWAGLRLSPTLAGAFMAFSSLAVVLNALRLRK